MIFAILTTLFSGLALAALVALAKHFNSVIKDFQEKNRRFHGEFDELKESQRNQIKAQIIGIYSNAVSRGYITFMELEIVNRLADSYFALGGNNYIHALMKKINDELPVKGEPIPNI